MKQSAIYPILLCLLLLAVAFPLQAQELLTNPGFEDPYIISGDDPPREVANGWSRWHVTSAPDAPSYINSEPEFYPAARDTADRVRSGENAQWILSFYATHVGGVYQTVSVTPGTTLRFSVFAYIWSSQFDEVDLSESGGDVTISVGIDPTGGTSGESDTIVWSEPGQIYDSYNEYSVEATTEGDTVTVFIRTAVGTPVKHNYIYLDDAVLISVEQADSPTEATDEVAINPTAESTEEVIATATTTATEEGAPPDVATATETTLPAVTETEASPAETVDPAITVEPSVTPTTEAPTEPDVEPSATPAEPDVEPTAMQTEVIVETATPVMPTEIIPTETSTPSPISPTEVPPTATSPAQITNTLTHTVQRGETVAQLAERYGSTIDGIRQANGLDTNYLIFIGQELLIPVSVPSDTTVVTATPISGEATDANTVTYTVLEGDSLTRIARLFNTSVGAIAQLNGIVSTDQIQVGQQLIVPRGQLQMPTIEPPPQTYTVLPGDTLYRISLRFGVSIGRIAEANNIINRNWIYIGQRLIIP